jgi:hypothetical protein
MVAQASGTPLPPKATSDRQATVSSPRLVASRLDALVVAFQIEPSPDVLLRLVERHTAAGRHGRAEVTIARLPFALATSRKADIYPIENADLRGVFDAQAAGGWNLEIVLRATYLATHSIDDAIALARRLAGGFGNARAVRLRRFDLCADFIGFPLNHEDSHERLVTTRSRTTTFLPESKDVDEADGQLCQPLIRTYRDSSRKVSGITISPGNPLMARIYDKTAELRLEGREDKQDLEQARWRALGWGGEQVTRVEFQHRGGYLDEIRLRDPDDLVDQVDAAWKRDVLWVRFVCPGTAKRLTRCRIDPRWRAVTDVVFFHAAQPIARRRTRGGAKPEHVLGAVRSRLASVGALRPIELEPTADGEVLSEETYVARLTADEATAWIQDYTRWAFEKAADDVAASLCRHHGPSGALTRVLVHHNATVARFTSVDDVAPTLAQPETS